MEGFTKNFLEWSARMCRRSATTGLIIEASRVLQETAGALSEPERGIDMRALETASRRVASCITRTEILRSDFTIVPCGLVDENNSEVTSAGQGCRQTRL